MTPEQFITLAAEGYNRIPVTREVLADTETPLSSYLKLADGPYSYLFESVQGGEKWGRYSIIGLPARERLEARGSLVRIIRDGELKREHTCADPLAFVKAYQAEHRVPGLEGLPNFSGGLVGYFAYDCVRYVEPKLADSAPVDEIGTPDILLTVSDEVLVFDNLQGTLHLIVHIDPTTANAYDVAQARLDELETKLGQGIQGLPAMPRPRTKKGETLSEKNFSSSYGRDTFLADVGRVKDYILAGDTMQVVLSQRLTQTYEAPPINLYRALRCLNPSPYMYF
jgi:anthranilate synthase, component I (EC 4.1.3.27)